MRFTNKLYMPEKNYIFSKISRSVGGKRLDQALAQSYPQYSRSKIKLWILKGYVKLDGKIVLTPKKMVLGGENIEIDIFNKKKVHWKAQPIPLNIIYEDEHILVINKPSNTVVYPGVSNPDNTILNALLYYFPPIIKVPRAGIVHRLDKNTTGLMIIAKTALAQAQLVNFLKTRQITRKYEAVVSGRLYSNGTITQSIARHKKRRTLMTVSPFGKPAISHYRLIERFRFHTHLDVHLETGRTHQIRVHMKYINHPVVGDPVYGTPFVFPKEANKKLYEVLSSFNRQALHANSLQLLHPVTLTKMEWRIPLPEDMLLLLSTLKEDSTLLKGIDAVT